MQVLHDCSQSTPTGGALCAVPALCVHCVKSRLDGQGDRSNYCVPIHRTAQILAQSKISGDGFKQTIFPTKNVRLLSKSVTHCCLF